MLIKCRAASKTEMALVGTLNTVFLYICLPSRLDLIDSERALCNLLSKLISPSIRVSTWNQTELWKNGVPKSALKSRPWPSPISPVLSDPHLDAVDSGSWNDPGHRQAVHIESLGWTLCWWKTGCLSTCLVILHKISETAIKIEKQHNQFQMVWDGLEMASSAFW